jgi:AraC-like DNA-binding protein
MSFITYIPCTVLQPYVKAFAISESAEEKEYKVLPGTGLVIGFQYKGKLARIEGEKLRPLNSAGLTGLHDSFHVFKNAADTGTVLVFFKEAGAAQFFNMPLHELFTESISLENFMLRSELLIVEEKLCESKTNEKRIKIIEQFLIARMQLKEPDNLVLAALSLIHKTKGTIRMQELLKQLHISQSPLEKRFRRVVGASPKKFASIVRFKHTIQNYNPKNSLTALGYESGFYDQAHFIKAFKSFTGESPETFFTQQ